MTIDPEDFTKDELSDMATTAGVATSGTKQEIADRLNEAGYEPDAGADVGTDAGEEVLDPAIGHMTHGEIPEDNPDQQQYGTTPEGTPAFGTTRAAQIAQPQGETSMAATAAMLTHGDKPS